MTTSRDEYSRGEVLQTTVLFFPGEVSWCRPRTCLSFLVCALRRDCHGGLSASDPPGKLFQTQVFLVGQTFDRCPAASQLSSELGKTPRLYIWAPQAHPQPLEGSVPRPVTTALADALGVSTLDPFLPTRLPSPLPGPTRPPHSVPRTGLAVHGYLQLGGRWVPKRAGGGGVRPAKRLRAQLPRTLATVAPSSQPTASLHWSH